jgi:Rod binding domain-containing protein
MTEPSAISALSSASIAGASPVDQADLPQTVREGSPKAKQAYETARGFEQVLLEQLTQSMCQTSGLGGEGEGEGAIGAGGEEDSSSQGGGGPFASMLPQVLAESVMHHGSLGLASQLTNEPYPAAAKPAAGAAGGTPA